jgi:AhpD family alkylhydroperoxidase
MTTPRIDLRAVAPQASNGFRQAGADAKAHGIEERLKHLIDIRASQINGCAYCLEMHVADAKKLGESDERLHLVAVWRETDVFTPRERAALAWTEAVTNVAQTGVPDEVYQLAREQFSEEELVYLTVAIAAINAFNRVNVALRTPVGAKRLAATSP